MGPLEQYQHCNRGKRTVLRTNAEDYRWSREAVGHRTILVKVHPDPLQIPSHRD